MGCMWTLGDNFARDSRILVSCVLEEEHVHRTLRTPRQVQEEVAILVIPHGPVQGACGVGRVPGAETPQVARTLLALTPPCS